MGSHRGDRGSQSDRQPAALRRRRPTARRAPARSSRSASQVSQLGPQRLARAGEPRLDGSHRQPERECDLFVLQSFDLPQHQRCPLLERQILNRRLQPRADLLASQLAIGRRRVGAQHHLAVIANVLVERHLICPLAPPPPSLPVPHLVDDDPEDPGAQRRLPAETVQGAEHPQEHLLRQIERLFAVAEQMGREAEHETVMLEHERGVREVVAGDAPFDECSFATGDLGRPSNCFGRFG